MRGITLALMVLAFFAPEAAAQAREAPALELAAGWVGFADDGIVSEGMIGGAARVYVSRRLAVGPELLHIRGTNHSHLVITGNMTFDVLPAGKAAAGSITPFLVVGVGGFQTRESFVSGTFSSWEGAFTAGGGIRAGMTDRITAGVDVRVGWETHLRVNGTIAVRLSD